MPKKLSPRIAPTATTTTTMTTSKIIRAPPLRSIGIVIPLLFAVAASSLVLLPASRPGGRAASRRTGVSSIHRTTPSLFFSGLEHQEDRREAGQWTSRAKTRSLSRGYRRWLSTALVTSTTTATEGPRLEITTASEWRRLAGFQFPQQDVSGAAEKTMPFTRANDAEEAAEIKRLQDQARAVANRHVVTSSTAPSAPQSAAIHSAEASSSRGEGIHLKKDLVTSVFSKPAVVHRRRSLSSSLTTEAAVEVPSISTHTRKSDATTEKQDSEASPPVPPVSVQEEINFASRREDKPEESHSLSQMTTVAAAMPDTASASTGPAVTVTVEEAPIPAPRIKAEVKESVPMANSSPLMKSGSDMTTSTASTKRKWTATASKLTDRVRRLRSQPKSAMVESILQARYAAIPDVGMRAYQILCDLEMVVPTPHPNDPNYDASCDDELAPENHYIR